ncbi:MAG: ribosome silencing factor [Rhabdochlamydiaceae bacterium]|nr:ribosome silencing factor [Rhabdochlamydiaceae bacterium]
MQKDLFFLLNKISQSIFDKKGSNILALDVRPSGSFSDFVIIAEGNVDKHTIAIAESVEKAMEEEGWYCTYVQGKQTGDWIVLDYTQIAIHLFIPSMRDKYQLERLWQKAEIVDVVIEVPENHCLNL